MFTPGIPHRVLFPCDGETYEKDRCVVIASLHASKPKAKMGMDMIGRYDIAIRAKLPLPKKRMCAESQKCADASFPSSFSAAPLVMRWPWMILFAWAVVICGGGLSAWNFISKRGFSMAPQGLYSQELQRYSELFPNEAGPQAAMMLSAPRPLMHFTNSSTCKLAASMGPGLAGALSLSLSCENETAAGGGCMTSSELQEQVSVLVKSFLAGQMSDADLSDFLHAEVQPLLDAAPEVTLCPHLHMEQSQQSMESIVRKVEASLKRGMPQCKNSVLSYWSLPAQEFHGKLSIAGQAVELIMKLPAGSFWGNFHELLSSTDARPNRSRTPAKLT